MREDENITKYVEKIKSSVSAIKASRGTIEDVIVVSEVLINLLPIYAIKVSSIQEMICDPNKKINLDALVRRLIAFELDNYDNYTPSSSNLESTFEAKVSLKKKDKSLQENNLKVKRKIVLTVILKPLKHYLQDCIPKVKESIQVKFL